MSRELRVFPKHGGVKAGKNYGLVVSEELLEEFREWLLGEGLREDSKQLREYMSKLGQLLGKQLTPDLVHSYASRSKRWYEALRRLITFIEVPSGLGMEELAVRLRRSLPKRPRTGTDTYVPPLEKVIEAGRRLKGTEHYTVYLLLVSTGARLATLLEVLEGLDASRLVRLDGIARYHVDYLRGEKAQWCLYAPVEAWEHVLEAPKPRGSYEVVAEAIREAGVKVKHYRNFVYNVMLSLGMPEGVVEFIVGHSPSTVGRRHYMHRLHQADKFYPLYAQWLRENVLSKIKTYDKG